MIVTFNEVILEEILDMLVDDEYEYDDVYDDE